MSKQIRNQAVEQVGIVWGVDGQEVLMVTGFELHKKGWYNSHVAFYMVETDHAMPEKECRHKHLTLEDARACRDNLIRNFVNWFNPEVIKMATGKEIGIET